jgi:hypothetical protein
MEEGLCRPWKKADIARFSCTPESFPSKPHIFPLPDKYIRCKRGKNGNLGRFLQKKTNHDQEIRFFDKNV